MQPIRALEKEAAVGRHGRLVAEQVAQHRRAAAGRVRPLDHLVELLRVADEHEVPGRRPHRERVGERHLTRLVDEQVVDLLVLAGEEPRRAGRQVGAEALVGVLDVLDRLLPVVRLRVACARLLAPVEGDPELARGLDDRVEQVVDRLVARRGDAHGLAVREQVRDQPPGRPRLARAGRPLDDEVTAVEREDELLHLLELGRLDRPVERLAAEDRLSAG